MRRAAANIILKDEETNKLKHVRFGFDLDYVKDYLPSEIYEGATYVSFYDETVVHIAMSFAEFNSYIDPQHLLYHKVNLNETRN